MPRKSPEERSFSLFRAIAKPPEPPTELLDPKAEELWRGIVGSHPADWWNPGSLQLLLRFCRTASFVEKLNDALELLEIGSKESRDVLKQIIACNASLSGLASRMRISQQAAIHRRSGQISEHGPGNLDADERRLLGGSAVVRQ